VVFKLYAIFAENPLFTAKMAKKAAKRLKTKEL